MKLKDVLWWVPLALIALLFYEAAVIYNGWPSLGLGLMEQSFMGLLWFFLIIPIVWWLLGGLFPDLRSSLVKELKKGTSCDLLSQKERIEWALRVLLCLLCLAGYMVKPG